MKIIDNSLKNIIKSFSYLYYKKNYKNRKSDYIPATAKHLNHEELFAMIEASLDMWLTGGRFHDEFENKFSEYLGVNHTLLCNSGSSANLLAMSALKSPLLKERALKDGDEVITVAAGFPTTINSIIQNNLVPIFVDIDIPTYNINIDQMKEALTEKTKAVFIAHTLGNPFNLYEVKNFCTTNNLFLIEDSCDALGSTYMDFTQAKYRKCGTFGDISTFSFYPAHHITGGEMGAVCTDNYLLKKAVMSIRDWGRECICPTGQDNFCGSRFYQQHGKLPQGFDHKYVYSNLGYNLKTVDWCAAIALAQLKKLPEFVQKRKRNFELLLSSINHLSPFFIFPEATKYSDPSWFGFIVGIKADNTIERVNLLKFLEENGIGTRLLFSGNVLKQPYFMNNPYKIRIRNSGILISNQLTEEHYNLLPNTEFVMNDVFWIGVHPNITEKDIKYIADKFDEYIRKL